MKVFHENLPVDTVDYGCSVNPKNRVELLRQRCLEQLTRFPGDVLEVGVYRGGTLLALAETVRQTCQQNRVIGVDTFSGHPYSDGHEVHPVGKYSDVSVPKIWETIKARELSGFVELAQGRAEIILPALDLHKVTFAHIDCDLYLPIKFCADYLRRRLPQHAVLFFDDYFHAHCPGATKAIREEFGADVPPIRLDDGTEWSCEINLGTLSGSVFSLLNPERPHDKAIGF